MKDVKLSILQQALFEEKNIAFEKRMRKAGKGSYAEQMKIILPETHLMYKQEKFVNAKQHIKFILGGFQSGKTEVFAANKIWLSNVNEPFPGLLISPTADNCELIMLTKIKKILNENGIGFKTKFYTGIIEVSVYFGRSTVGTLLLGAGSSTLGWIGMTVAFVGMDEPFRQSSDTNRDMISRASEPNAVLPMISYSGTPEPDSQDWGEDVIDAKEEDSPERFITTLSTRDNIYLQKHYVKTLESELDSEQQKNYIDGEATSRKGGRMYYMYDDKENVEESSEFIIDAKAMNIVLLVFDFNTNPITAAEFLIRHPELIEVDEYKINNSNTWDLTKLTIHRLKQRYSFEGERRPLENVHLVISGDATGQKSDTTHTDPNFNNFTIIKQLFSAAGIQYYLDLEKTNPLVQPRVAWVNNLCEKKYFKILSHCIDSRTDMRKVKRKSGIAEFKKDKSNKKLTHFSDIIDYASVLARRMGAFPVHEIQENESDMEAGEERMFK